MSHVVCGICGTVGHSGAVGLMSNGFELFIDQYDFGEHNVTLNLLLINIYSIEDIRNIENLKYITYESTTTLPRDPRAERLPAR